MKHISSYDNNFTPIIKPPYTVFVKNGIMLLGFNDGLIFPRQILTEVISCPEKPFFCRCKVHISNSNFKSFQSHAESVINLSDDFVLNINGIKIEGVRNVFYENIEDILLKCTFEVDCNIETLDNDVYFADPIIENISKKFKLHSVYNLNMAYKMIKGLNRATMQDVNQFLEIGIPLIEKLGYSRIQYGEVDFNEFYQALVFFNESKRW